MVYHKYPQRSTTKCVRFTHTHTHKDFNPHAGHKHAHSDCKLPVWSSIHGPFSSTGGWTPEAQQNLTGWLAATKRTRRVKPVGGFGHQLALGAPPLLALGTPPPLAVGLPPLPPPAEEPEEEAPAGDEGGPSDSDSDSKSDSDSDSDSEATSNTSDSEANRVTKAKAENAALQQRLGEVEDAMAATEEFARETEEENNALLKDKRALTEENEKLKKTVAKLKRQLPDPIERGKHNPYTGQSSVYSCPTSWLITPRGVFLCKKNIFTQSIHFEGLGPRV